MTTRINVNTICDWDKVPGSNTYFRTSDVSPSINGDTLNIYNATGISRGWGTPSVRSEVTELTPDVIRVRVRGWHKHTIRPVGGDFYFVRHPGGWRRNTAAAKVVKAAIAAYEAGKEVQH